MKTGIYDFERKIIALHFVEKNASLPYLFRRKRGGRVVQVSFQSVAVALLSFARWRRYRADSPLLWTTENDALSFNDSHAVFFMSS